MAAYIQAVYDTAVSDYDNHAYPYSSIHGSVTDRSMVKDSFVFGEVIMRGDCKMVGCVVAPDTTVIMEDGAVAVNCMFGQHQSDSLARTIHIGPNSVIAQSQVDMQTTLGKNSCIYGSMLECAYNYYAQLTPSVTIGNHSLVVNSCIRIIRPRCRFITMNDDVSKMHTPSMRFGNRAVIIRSELSNSDNNFEAGDDIVIGGYDTLLQACLGDLVDVTRTPSDHPAGQGFNAPDSVLHSLMPSCFLLDDTDIGNRVTLMASLGCHNSDYAAVKNKVDIGDDTIIGIDQFIALDEYTDPTYYGLSMDTGNVILESGSTLIMSGAAKCSRHNGTLHLEEGATAVLPQHERGRRTTDPIEINIMPNAIVSL